MTPSTSAHAGDSEMPSGVPTSISAPMVDRMARSAHSAVDRVSDGASSAVGRVRSGVTDTLSTVSDKAHGLALSREQWIDSCRQPVRDHPLAAVGVALAAGYMIARWLRS